MTIAELLQKVHIQFEKNTDYPEASSEDFAVRLEYISNGIDEIEKEVKKGIAFRELKKSASIVATGTGTDTPPTDFSTFIKANESPAIITDGSTEWKETTIGDGNRMADNDINDAYVFWMEAGKIRTLPAISGTITFPYIKKLTRYPLGTEATEFEIEDEDKFLLNYVLAQLFLDDDNLSQYNARIQTAQDILTVMVGESLTVPPSENDFGIGE